MRINKQAVLDKIDAHYQQVAAAEHDKQASQQLRWDQWRAEQANQSHNLAAALRELAERVDEGQMVDKRAIADAVEDVVHDRRVPYEQRRDRGDWYEYPQTRPEVVPVETILDGLRARGRFTDLLGVLTNMVGDDVAVSSLQKLGVLDATDARLLFAASKSA
jgi:hypothetical protein